MFPEEVTEGQSLGNEHPGGTVRGSQGVYSRDGFKGTELLQISTARPVGRDCYKYPQPGRVESQLHLFCTVQTSKLALTLGVQQTKEWRF